jgi:acyl carrier protein
VRPIEEQVRRFVIENFLFADDDPDLRDDTSFLDTGIIDSTGVLELVTFLEREFGIAIEDDELLPENLDSVDRIAAFIRRKRGRTE